MNYNDKNSIAPNTKMTTADVMAQIKAFQATRSQNPAGLDYFSKRVDPTPNVQADAALNEPFGATALNVKSDGAEGATALNNKDGIKNFKAVAPTAHPLTASSGDDDITLGSKALAADASEPMEKAVAVSLCSPNDEQEVQNTCGGHDDPDPTTAQPDQADDDVMFDPEFFKISVDFFDNGQARDKTRYTAKLSIQNHPDDDPADNDKLFANFYSRSRQFRAFINKQECWDNWYDQIWSIFEDTCKREIDFKIKPHISILKERSFVNGNSTYDAVVHTACILYQAHGQAPELMIIYKYFMAQFTLDAKFQSKDAKAPLSKGYYVDPARAELEPQKQAKGMKVKTRQDFRK